MASPKAPEKVSGCRVGVWAIFVGHFSGFKSLGLGFGGRWRFEGLGVAGILWVCGLRSGLYWGFWVEVW